ncbi:histidine phosphatase family protein [Agrobacterium tumefaciens]|uniref:histidine phosphatase family protein n=1 Tax=Agrobacterium tumefaciens TaxID=358 RepID=UPI001574A826|nr:histidine phosphatase family protein [Agrobacterium tumefaciens]
MRLIMLRHGETVWNIQKRLQGHEDSPLSERGIKQAKAIADTLYQLAPARAVASDLGRTRQTASLAGYGNAISDPRLRELHMGEWTGCAKDELIAERPREYADWRAGLLTPIGGESWSEFTVRIGNGLRDLAKQGEGDLLAVVHSGVVRAACTIFLGIQPHQILPVTPGALTIFEFAGSDLSKPRLEAYNVGPRTPDNDVAD